MYFLDFTSKTVCEHFHKKRGILAEPNLILNGKKIRVARETKFLGVVFDQKLSFIPHLKALKSKCLKALDIIKVVSNQEWGADKSVLLRLYRSLVRSKLDYGCIVYGSARHSYTKMLDTIHHQGLRLALGAFRTSPVESLYVEAGELPLEHRRIKLSLQYITKLKSSPSNPAFNCVFRPEYENKYLAHTKIIPPLGIRMKEHMEGCDILIDQINEDDMYDIPPWEISTPTVNFESKSYLCTSLKAGFFSNKKYDLSCSRIDVGLARSYLKLLLSSWKTYMCNLMAWYINK